MMVKKFMYDIKSLSWTAIISLLLCTISAAVIYYTELPETLLKHLSTAVIILSVLSGGFYAGKVYGSKGLLHGSRIGLLVFALILTATLVLRGTEAIGTKEIISTMLICCVSGAVGGILGIGFAEKDAK